MVVAKIKIKQVLAAFQLLIPFIVSLSTIPPKPVITKLKQILWGDTVQMIVSDRGVTM